MPDTLDDNRACWDDLVPVHVHSDHYDVARFLEGACSLGPIESELLPDLTGSKVVHLQCHFGLDTLSLWRRGAVVTGLDFSPAAIHAANTLAAAIGADATFIEADVAWAADAVAGPFDIVFTSWGVLMWLEDLQGWARQVATLLTGGGRLVLVETHPLLWSMLESDDELVLRRPYMGGARQTEDIQGSYANEDAEIDHPRQHTWQHGLGEVVTALLGAGLQLESLTEHDAIPSQVLPMLEQSEDGMWRLPADQPNVPLSFSLVARSGPVTPASGHLELPALQVGDPVT